MTDLPEHPADPVGPQRCDNCDKALPPRPAPDEERGRPRRWCSAYCRHAGFVAERELAELTIGAHETVCGQCFLVHPVGGDCP